MKIVKSNEALEVRNLLTVIYGDPGLGKTSLSFTGGKNPLHFDFDGGIGRAYQPLRPDSAPVPDFGAWYQYLMTDQFEALIEENGYDSVVMDTAGAMLDDHATPYLIKTNSKYGMGGGLSLKGYGAMKTLFNTIYNRLNNLGLEVIVVAHKKNETDGDSEKATLSVTGSTAQMLFRKADFLGFLDVEGDRRVLKLEKSQFYQSKDSAQIGNVAIPDATMPNYNTFLADLIEKTKQSMLEKSEAQLKVQEVMEEYKASLAECKKIADFEAFMAGLSEEPSDAIKVPMRTLFKEALDQAGLKVVKGKISKKAKAKAPVEEAEQVDGTEEKEEVADAS